MRVTDFVRYEDGFLYWTKHLKHTKVQAGTKASCKPDSLGYVTINFQRKRLRTSRVIWELLRGPIPKGMQIDHINGDRSDNHIENLRVVSRFENMQNQRKALSHSTTGLLGIRKNKGKYEARISTNNSRISLGSYFSPHEAHEAYLQAKRKLHATCTI